VKFFKDRNPASAPTDEEIWKVLAPQGQEALHADQDRVFELYKLMVTSSEALVARRQGVNTFFLTANGALLTGIGLVIKAASSIRIVAAGVLVLAFTGALLSYAWKSLLTSFGQLNKGKFAVINRLERELPAAIYSAEWKALAEGQNPSIYRSFTSREVWAPWGALTIYGLVAVAAIIVIIKG